jgi:cyclopropane fatty-acyl-phospholipid synthase-like methyltransferase
MSAYDPIDLLFGGMEKLGPGSNADSLHVLRLLPEQPWRSVVDAGCGTGRQTLLLAKELGVIVHAIDSHQPFLDSLVSRAQEEQLGHLVEVHCMDMKAIPQVFQGVDLLWSEGAAYNIGFPHALAVWGNSVAAHGLAVVSELSWLKQQVPAEVTDFFRSGYPDMQSVPDNLAIARSAGYSVLTTHTLPGQAWVDGYYDVLAPRARTLLNHPDAAVRDFAAETVREIEVFDRSEDSYGYVFYVLQRA